MKKRLFVAVEIPGKIKEKIIELQKNFEQRLNDISWVKPENMHLTLVFLGEADYNQIPNIIACLERIKDDAFEISLAEIGGFPNLNKLHTLWVGVKENSAINDLHEKISKSLGELNFNLDDRKFFPHITFGRLKRPKTLKKLPSIQIDLGSFGTKEFILFDSTLTRGGSKHKIIKKFSLK